MKKLLLCSILLLAFVGIQSQGAEGFVVVINESNPTTEMDAKRMAKMFLKKIKRWEDKEAVIPVDQSDDSTARERFTEAVHKKSVSAIKSYWQRMIFSGRDVPPTELGSDQAVLDFVRQNRGAIGYVTSGTELGEGIKELIVTD